VHIISKLSYRYSTLSYFEVRLAHHVQTHRTPSLCRLHFKRRKAQAGQTLELAPHASSTSRLILHQGYEYYRNRHKKRNKRGVAELGASQLHRAPCTFAAVERCTIRSGACFEYSSARISVGRNGIEFVSGIFEGDVRERTV
jgi:hypothetical protein